MSNTLHDQVRRINVVATSPDGLVRARYGKQVVVEINPKCARRHNDRTLAEQATKAIDGALKGYDVALRKVMRGGETKSVDDMANRDVERRANFLRATRLISVEVESAGSDINAGWRPGSGLTITLRPRTLDRLGTNNLASELSTVVTTLMSRIARARDKAYDACYLS